MINARNLVSERRVAIAAEPQVLIAEYKDHATACAAAKLLYPEGIEMGDVRVRGLNWLGAAEPGGTKTLAQVCVMGAEASAIGFSLAGFVIGTFASWPDGMTVQSLLNVLMMLMGGAVFGATVGTAMGAIFWSLSHEDALPNWVEPEYGARLRAGAHFVFVKGRTQTLLIAREALGKTEPVTLATHRLGIP